MALCHHLVQPPIRPLLPSLHDTLALCIQMKKGAQFDFTIPMDVLKKYDRAKLT
jgi:hypothetical protein